MVRRYQIHFFLSAQEHSYALVQSFWGNVENIFMTVCRAAAGLLDEPTHRIGFVHQTELTGFGRIAIVLRVHENAAAIQNAMNFSDHGGNPTHVVVLAARTGLAG